MAQNPSPPRVEPSARFFRVFYFRAGKEPLAERLERILAATGEPGRGCARLLFLLTDNPYLKVSAVDRVLKAHPEMAAFRHDGPVGREMRHYPPYKALGNFPPPWSEHNTNRPEAPVSPETLLDILRGVPRRFPFLRTDITLDGVDWAGEGVAPTAGPAEDDHPPVPGFGRYLYPSVTLSRDPRQDFHAVVELPTPEATLHETIAAKLAAIGNIRCEVRRVRYEGAQLEALIRARDEASRFVERFKAGLHGWLADEISLPAALPAALGSGTDRPFSLKKTLVDAFRPLGFRYVASQSGEGGYTLEKRTPLNHRLVVFVDRGTWSRSLSCSFGFLGLEKTHSIDVPAHPGQTVHSYPADGQAIADAVVANWAAVIAGLERDFVGALAGIYGPDPDWA